MVLEIHGLDDIDHHHEEHSGEEENDHHHEEHSGEEENDHHYEEQSFEKNDNHNESNSPNITALLITTKSPIANVNLPNLINKESRLQAANPSLEITRLTSMLGLGSKSFIILSIILIIISVLTIFTGLASNLENRMGDLAILRAIGYSKKEFLKLYHLKV